MLEIKINTLPGTIHIVFYHLKRKYRVDVKEGGGGGGKTLTSIGRSALTNQFSDGPLKTKSSLFTTIKPKQCQTRKYSFHLILSSTGVRSLLKSLKLIPSPRVILP